MACTPASFRGVVAVTTVTVNLAGTATGFFSFNAPVVTAVRLNGAASGGSSVSVSGMSFGAVDQSTTGALEMMSCSTSSWTSATTLACLRSAVTSMSGTAAVTVGSIAGTMTSGLSFDAPVVSCDSVGANVVQSGGESSVTISGLSFGSSMASGTASLEADGACASTAWTSSTSVGCAGATLSGSGRRTAVSVSGLVGTMTSGLSFDAPVVS